MSTKRFVRATAWLAAGLVLLVSGSGCAGGRGRPFASPQDGAQALVAALRPLNVDELRSILGPDADELISSGDSVADQNAADDFVASYENRHDIVMEDDETATVVVGEHGWPLPIPLERDGQSWYFDADEGK